MLSDRVPERGTAQKGVEYGVGVVGGMQSKTYRFLHPGHSMRTIPVVYDLFENWCVLRVLHSSAVQVNVKLSVGSWRTYGCSCP